jgi:hypothetical protein|tara:strand:- start:219 stop:602 length:384 start_codon:yes stop_codon:yes gene_type:complete
MNPKKPRTWRELIADARIILALLVAVVAGFGALSAFDEDIRWWPWRWEHNALAAEVREFEEKVAIADKAQEVRFLEDQLQRAKRIRRSLGRERRQQGPSPQLEEDALENKERIENLKRSLEFLKFGK